jgi:glycine/D-amino acid oxidase-like deaminating enzyme
VVTILGAGVAGSSLAWALVKRGRKDVVVFDPAPAAAGSTSRALGGFRTQHGSDLNIALALASRSFFVKRADRVHFQPNGYLFMTGPYDWLGDREIRAPRAAVPEPAGYHTCNYEVTFDHHALVGETLRPGVWSSCSFSGHGVMHSPAVADSLAAMINGDSPPLDIRSLSPQRTEPLIDPTQL